MRHYLTGLALACAMAAPAVTAENAYTPPALIDYSALHNVLIRSDDGTLTPADVPYYRSKLIAPGTWQIESDGDYSYLIEGDKEALAIDTGYGAGNIRQYLQTLTQKPVRMVASTHFHFDHTALNGYFDRALMSKETAEKATIPYPSFGAMKFPRDYPVQIVKDGDVIPLGGRDILVIMGGNHTPGSTMYLDTKQRILFGGDEFMPRGVRVGITVEQFAGIMERVVAHRGQFDRIAGGPGIFDGHDADKLLAAAQAVLAGKEGEMPKGGPGGMPGAANGPATPEGVTVYQRRAVRAPDRPAGLGGAPSPTARVMAVDGLQISYDVNRIR
ncbi:glyoxylase-like metal-dependent hydrolase (beta-lactamase superfamily II) [Novosphingobium sp. SG751A]|uniref:MBL fold metallo-hydrolase n=1 Tax=Novosphingobium sp. SG751A TaxID=2587000 RepID=UPI0015561921|nr:MBL fold metallo-hydrolase [Novosphingobium sp. SG751A]NOW48811.1 glyoxylase-like metal-dependent hydrolase (beta-lactamase superfamily II) [Novosphingobium sp. SG751A]